MADSREDSEVGALLEHACRCWDAEQENASRLTTDTRLVLSLNTAAVGLITAALVRTDWRQVGASLGSALGAVILVLIIIALALFALSIAQLLLPLRWSRRRDEQATEVLRVVTPAGDSERAGATSADDEASDPDSDTASDEASAPSATMQTGPVSEFPSASGALFLPPEWIGERLEQLAEVDETLTFVQTYDAALDLYRRNARRKLDVSASKRLLLAAFLPALIAALLYAWVGVWSINALEEVSDGADNPGHIQSGNPASEESRDAVADHRPKRYQAPDPPRDADSSSNPEAETGARAPRGAALRMIRASRPANRVATSGF